jgi:hypothetical protein
MAKFQINTSEIRYFTQTIEVATFEEAVAIGEGLFLDDFEESHSTITDYQIVEVA